MPPSDPPMLHSLFTRPSGTAEIEPAELAAKLKSAPPPRLLDVREPQEHALVALPGARLIPLGELGARMEEIGDWRGEEVVVYCHHGMRSLRAAGMLRQKGFAQARSLRGGIDRWSLEMDSNLPRY